MRVELEYTEITEAIIAHFEKLGVIVEGSTINFRIDDYDLVAVSAQLKNIK